MVNLVPAPIEVPDNAGFDPNIDTLNRKPFGEALTNLVQALPDGAVIALDSPWGEGKSTFIKMWLGHLSQLDTGKIKNIYFDAFEHDYSDDAFICLSAELLKFFEEYTDKGDALKKAAISVGKRILNIGLKVATFNAVNESVLEGAESDIAHTLSDVVDRQIWERIETQKGLKESINDFRQKLEDIVREHAGGQLVFVIDELDRCRPDFAVAVVEQVKHLFTAKGVIFVLVINGSQLQESVRGVYGLGIDAEQYLQKFVNIWATLPPKQPQYNSFMEYQVFIGDLLNQMQIRTEPDGTSNPTAGELEDQLNMLATKFLLSLRQLEKVITNVAMVYAVLAPSDRKEPSSIAILAVLKVARPDVFNDLLQIRDGKNIKTLLRKESRINDLPYSATLEYLSWDKQELSRMVLGIETAAESPFDIYRRLYHFFGQEAGAVYLHKYTRAMSTFLTV